MQANVSSSVFIKGQKYEDIVNNTNGNIRDKYMLVGLGLGW